MRYLFYLILTALTACGGEEARAQQVMAQPADIIPKPASLQTGKGEFRITPSTQLVFNGGGTEKSAVFLNDYLVRYYGFSLPVSDAREKPHQPNIRLHLNAGAFSWVRGAYILSVTKKGIDVQAGDPEGIFYGMQTLIRLLPLQKTKSLAIPRLSIVDSPRFSYRGLNLDVSRHFFDVDFIKRYLDLMALYKLNVFHWHLTDDQGWRIEIKKYPLLTGIGSTRNGTITGHYPGSGNDNTPYGGYYTQDQVREVVKYAADRFITVIPEIEMPGHSSAAIAAYPWLSCFPQRPTNIPTNMVSLKSVEEEQKDHRIKLVQETWGVFDDVYCAGKDSTFLFLQDVLDEVIPLFPSKYIHIGGDECPKTNWKQCPRCRERIKENNLKDEHALQSYFIQRIEKYLNGKGKQIIGWDEILEGGLAPNATVMSWRGEAGGIEAARQHHDVIMTPGNYCYFNRSERKKPDSLTAGNFLPIEKVYGYNPVSDSLTPDQAHYIIGAQASLWTEYIASPAKVEYMVLPRLSAMSEVLWSRSKDWNEFKSRLLHEYRWYDRMGLNYCPPGNSPN
jgi:hexosaminidase